MKDYEKEGYLFDPDLFLIQPELSLDSPNRNKETIDDTLLFMTMAVTMTAENEMPIVSPYTDALPKDILGYYRTNPHTPVTTAPHFYFCDKKNKQYWGHPFRTEKKLGRFDVSIAPDFSMTAEMSTNQKRYSSFLNKLCAAWMQSRGHAVIPNVSFPDEYWENYWIEGWPKHSIIAVSSVGVLTHGNPEVWLKGVERIWSEIEPIHVLRYGPVIPGERTANCTYFSNDNKRAAGNGRKWFL